eukprot:g7774.t1
MVAKTMLRAYDASLVTLLRSALLPGLLAADGNSSGGSSGTVAAPNATTALLLHGVGSCAVAKRVLLECAALDAGSTVLSASPSDFFECGGGAPAAAGAPLVDVEARRGARLRRLFELASRLGGGTAGCCCDRRGDHAAAAPAAPRPRVVLLLEGLGALFPAEGGRASSGAVGEEERRLLLQFVGCMDAWAARAHSLSACGGAALFAVVGIAADARGVHPAARARFGLELGVDAPMEEQRLFALRAMLGVGVSSEDATGGGRNGDGEGGPEPGRELAAALPSAARECHGLGIADLRAVVRDACALSLCAAGARAGAGASCEAPTATTPAIVTPVALRQAIREHLPFALRGAALHDAERGAGGAGDAGTSGAGGGGADEAWRLVSRPAVRWTDVAGHAEAKRALRQLVVWPHVHARALQRVGIDAVNGVLLYGPPGTGKTMLAQATAAQIGARFLSLAISQLVRAEVGESEKQLQATFALARRCAPTIVFIDEFQALFGERGSGGGSVSDALSSQLLLEMDGLWQAQVGGGSGGGGGEQRVMVLAATNTPEAVDPAFLRPGRFDKLVYVGALDAEGRRVLLRRVAGRARWGSDVNADIIASRTTGYTGAELAALCRCAAMHAVADGADEVRLSHFERQLRH